jgi:hypothetical protein
MKAQVYTSSSFMIQETNHPHGKLKLAGKFVRRVVMEVGRLFPKKKKDGGGQMYINLLISR